MVFRVKHKKTNTEQAIKIVRKKLIARTDLPTGAAATLSPVSEHELLALEKLSHTNVVHLYDAIESKVGVIAISTTYVEDPSPLNLYFTKTLATHPDKSGRKGLHSFSPERLEAACDFLVKKIYEIASALKHMHENGIYHFDVKPANILISGKHDAMLTDLGACVHDEQLQTGGKFRVHFTWTYAHPDLTTIINKPGSISGGGLKASAEISTEDTLQKFDLFALGRTIQEILAILEIEFGERCHAIYGFKFLHLIACLLLDGHNARSHEGKKVPKLHEIRLSDDDALNYPIQFYQDQKIRTSEELVDRLNRFSREYSWNAAIPELDSWQKRTLNTGVAPKAPFSLRVEKIVNHPCLRRLKLEPQLGWVREVYPGATHNRWSHSIGVFSSLIRYYNALLADPDIPTLRIIINPVDIQHAMVAALIHDIGQIGFGHDLESACPHLYKHEKMIERLLNERTWSSPNLQEVITIFWNNVDIKRVLNILENHGIDNALDSLASDIINGPIDADKYDYLRRDSDGCGVPYGKGIDFDRFLQALSVNPKGAGRNILLGLAYKSKGSPVIESLLLARYQMYNAVYWHHTFRCIQAMFTHATASTFGILKHGRRKLRESITSSSIISELLYHWVICSKSKNLTREAMKGKTIPSEFYNDPPPILSGERMLEFVWKFADDSNRVLLERLGTRDLYKRVYELKINQFSSNSEYYNLQNVLSPEKFSDLSSKIEKLFLDNVYRAMVERGPSSSSIAENDARARHQEIKNQIVPKVILDFPSRGIPQEENFPSELSDPARKYLASHEAHKNSSKVFHVVKDLQTQSATLRVFVAKELHELIIRYLDPAEVEACVGEVIPKIKSKRY